MNFLTFEILNNLSLQEWFLWKKIYESQFITLNFLESSSIKLVKLYFI